VSSILTGLGYSGGAWSDYNNMVARDRKESGVLKNTTQLFGALPLMLTGMAVTEAPATLGSAKTATQALIKQGLIKRAEKKMMQELSTSTIEQMTQKLLPTLGKKALSKMTGRQVYETYVDVLTKAITTLPEGSGITATPGRLAALRALLSKYKGWIWKAAIGADTVYTTKEMFLAKGGFPGSPRGTDTVPAWLTPGEFVVNANASARYRGLLEQLNSFGGTTRPNFISPQYKQGGGSIGETKIYYNNNVTINHPTGNPALDATRIVQEINRQQSRGTARVRTR
jgi:hypothetical protein